MALFLNMKLTYSRSIIMYTDIFSIILWQYRQLGKHTNLAIIAQFVSVHS